MDLSRLNNRINFERLLCLVTITSALMMTATVGVFGYSIDSEKIGRQKNEGGICTTPACVRTAEEIIQSLDESVDPCDNFFKFACGGWLAKHSIPDDKTRVSVFGDVGDELNLQLKTLLDKELDGSEPKAIKLVKNMYDSCMNLEDIEKAGSEPLKKILNDLGGWPVVLGDKWDESNFNWMDSVFAFRKLGFDYSILISMGVSVDFKNNKVHSIGLDQASLGMPSRKYLINGLNDSVTQAYFNLMVKSAKLLGVDVKIAEYELLEALNFEITLAKLSQPEEERRDFDKMYNKFTIPQLRELSPQIEWSNFLNGLLNDPITENETVVVFDPNFLKQFGNLITKTDKRIVANYMMWRVVLSSVSSLSKEWRALENEYSASISGQNQESPRWETCLSAASSSLGIALSSYYVKHYFKGDSKQKAEEMVNYLRNEFINILEEVDWMDDETRKLAIEKAKAIHPYIGYPQELANDTIVGQFYGNLTITNENYLDNELSITKWIFDYSFSELRKPNKKGEWYNHATVAMVNAFYSPLENSIDLPAGILQKVFFNKDRPNYMNFGGIGYVIGHEITHGFDDMGKQFDKEGNNKIWWDQTTDEHFKEKAQCIIDQYGNYTADNGMKLNGVMTQGENIADNGGMKEAYLAYRSWVKDHSPEGRLPGLKYTPNQLFWISAANVWCGKHRPEMLKLVILTDAHSPFEFRVIGPMSNSKEFATSFGCRLGSNMNPEKKCEVW